MLSTSRFRGEVPVSVHTLHFRGRVFILPRAFAERVHVGSTWRFRCMVVLGVRESVSFAVNLALVFFAIKKNGYVHEKEILGTLKTLQNADFAFLYQIRVVGKPCRKET